jgi:hypothetical protein
MSLLAVFFISIHLPLNSPNDKLPLTSFRIDLMQEIAFLKKQGDNRAFSGGCEFHEAQMEREKG